MKHVQRLLGIETGSETPTYELTPLNSDQSNLLYESGILLGERMVKLVEYHTLLITKPVEAIKVLEILRIQSEKINIAISTCHEITGRNPVSILTKEQREYIESHKEAVEDSRDKAELYEGLERAVTIDHDYSAEQSYMNEPERMIEKSAAKVITLELIPA